MHWHGTHIMYSLKSLIFIGIPVTLSYTYTINNDSWNQGHWAHSGPGVF